MLASNKHVSATELCKQADAMTAADITRVAKEMMQSPLTFAGHGDCMAAPTYDQLASAAKSISA